MSITTGNGRILISAWANDDQLLEAFAATLTDHTPIEVVGRMSYDRLTEVNALAIGYRNGTTVRWELPYPGRHEAILHITRRTCEVCGATDCEAGNDCASYSAELAVPA